MSDDLGNDVHTYAMNELGGNKMLTNDLPLLSLMYK